MLDKVVAEQVRLVKKTERMEYASYWGGIGVLFGVGGFLALGVSRGKKDEEWLEEELALVRDQLAVFSSLAHSRVYTKSVSRYFTSANSAMCAHMGVSEERLIGATFADYFSPEDAHELALLEVGVIEGGGVVINKRLQRVGSQGEIVHYDLSIGPLKDRDGKILGLLFIETDRAEITVLHEKLISAENAFDSLLERLPIGVAIVDAETQCFVMVNAALERISDFSRSEIEGNSCRSVICLGETGKCPVLDMHRAMNNSERTLTNRKGEQVSILQSARAINYRGRECLIEFVVDISTYKKGVKERDDVLRRLQYNQAILQSLMEDADFARAELEKTAREEQRIRALLERQKDFICRCDYDYNITFSNQTFQKLPSCKSLREIWPKTFFIEYMIELDRSKRSGDPVIAAFEVNDSDGDARWINWSISPILGENGECSEFLIVGRDITRQHQIESRLVDQRRTLELRVREQTKSLREANEKLQNNLTVLQKAVDENTLFANIIEQADEMILATDLSGQLIYVNQSYFIRHPALQGVKDGEMLHERIIEQATKKEPWSGQLLCRLDNDQELLMDCSVFPVLNENKELVAMASIQRDITEQALINAQLRQSQKMEAVGTLAGGIAHDFNNLLMSISGFAELARKKILLMEDEKLLRYVDNVIGASSRGNGLVSQLLQYARPDESLGIKRDDHVCMDQLLGEVVNLIASSTPVGIHIHEEYVECPEISANSGQIHQVLVNLARNAIHAMGDAGHLYFSLETVVFTESDYSVKKLPASGMYLCVCVRDTGSGISSENCDRIFDPFFTTKKVGEGSGMGLAIAYSIVREHKGSLLVNSVLGEGTEFQMYLPCEEYDIQGL